MYTCTWTCTCIRIYACLQFHAVVGVLMDDADPMVSVMKLEKAPEETYADIGGLDAQIQEIKVHEPTHTSTYMLWQTWLIPAVGIGRAATHPPRVLRRHGN